VGRAEETLEKVRRRRERHKERHLLYRTIFAIAAFFVVVGGIVLSLPLVPGPGVLLIAIGLSMLALEFTWAERVLEKTLLRVEAGVNRFRRRRGSAD
jgi:uncharacterized protein (TIGR02611 family)